MEITILDQQCLSVSLAQVSNESGAAASQVAGPFCTETFNNYGSFRPGPAKRYPIPLPKQRARILTTPDLSVDRGSQSVGKVPLFLGIAGGTIRFIRGIAEVT